MKNRLVTLLGIAALIVVVTAFSSLYTVRESSQVLVLQFGEPVRVVTEPGLKFKLPFVQNVVYFDRRVLDYDAEKEEIIAADQKRLVVDAFLRYRITDPLKFFQTVGNEMGVRARLGALISGALRRVIGNVTLSSVLSEERSDIMKEISRQVNTEANPFGIEVLDVRVRRADLPEENSQAIYARMQAEREREAKEFRAQGAELGQRIRSRADRERTVILADAEKNAQILRGEGEGEAVRIYADAFKKDENFFAFYRSLEAYRKSIGDDTTLVLSPESEFFEFFDKQKGR